MGIRNWILERLGGCAHSGRIDEGFFVSTCMRCGVMVAKKEWRQAEMGDFKARYLLRRSHFKNDISSIFKYKGRAKTGGEKNWQ